MREYAKLGPKFWQGNTGKALRKRGAGAVVMALYLMSSPHSNMLGLYSQPMMYAAYETGLGLEGASDALRHCIEVGFCAYDEDSEMVWVFEMAKYQIAEELLPKDNRCKGIQKDYDALPECPFLGPFFDRYAEAFHMTHRRGSDEGATEAPSKPGTGAGAGAGTEGAQNQAPSEPPPPASRKPRKQKAAETTLAEWLATIQAAGEKAIPNTDAVFGYAREIGLPAEFLHIAWFEFKARYTAEPVKGQRQKTYTDWRAVFRKAVREGWLKLWYLDGQQYALTAAGQQAQRAVHAQQQREGGEA